MTTCWCYGCVFVTSSFAYIAAFQMEFIARSIIIRVFPSEVLLKFKCRALHPDEEAKAKTD